MSDKERIEKAIKYIGIGLRQLSFCKESKCLRAIQKISEALSILGEE
jgi:hypothetical protein